MENTPHNVLRRHLYELLEQMVGILVSKVEAICSNLPKNGDQLLNDLLPLRLPPHDKLFTSDAHSMYNNIDTDHAITVITWWIEDLHNRNPLPTNFPKEAVLTAMVTIMKNYIFEFGDLFFLQLLGTAMGTSAAVMWATLYYAYHEVHTILPKYDHLLLYFKRYIGDIFGIWLGTSNQE